MAWPGLGKALGPAIGARSISVSAMPSRGRGAGRGGLKRRSGRGEAPKPPGRCLLRATQSDLPLNSNNLMPSSMTYVGLENRPDFVTRGRGLRGQGGLRPSL